jgi:DNA primase
MSRIPEGDIERLKAAVPLEMLCGKYGIELKPKGKDLFGLCPFHADKTPSFSVTPEKNLWNCLAGCGGGSNFDLVMKCEKVSFTRAYQVLKQAAGEAPAVTTYTPRAGKEKPILVDPAKDYSDAQLLEVVTNYYHQTFLNHPQAMQYLQERKCFHPEAVTKFKLGYANRSLGYQLPLQNVAGRALRAQLQNIGILRESGHEHLSGCVVVPVFSESEVTELYGRRITRAKALPEGSPHLYLPGSHEGVWNAEELKSSRVWLLCESAIDALSLWCQGFHHVTWSYGVNGFSPDHWTLLRAVRPEKIVVCYDNDEAGNKAANELAQRLEPEGVAVWRVELKPRSDLNDLVRNSDDPKAALSSLLAAAVRLLPESHGNLTQPEPARIAPHSVAGGPAGNPAFVISEDGREATLEGAGRCWRVRGFEVNTSFDVLKANVRLQVGTRFHLNTFDLYQARHRAEFVAVAGQITGADKNALEGDLAALITHMEREQQNRIAKKMAATPLPQVTMTPEEESEAMAVLKNPRLLDVIIADQHRCGMVGEDTNLAVSWLVSISRKLTKPLGVCVMSRSAAGKSTLLESVAELVPDEDKHQYTALTPQALFHMPENELKHKALFLAEDVGAEGASYSLKTIQSDGKLVIACTMKDEDTGQMVTKTKIVHGPVALFLTSTNRSVDSELLNRLLVLTIDESAEQTDRIHAAQRHENTLQGIIEQRARPKLRKLHQNIQRLIRPLQVQNPFEHELTFGSRTLRSRRDNRKYLQLINVMALVYQYQRPIESAVDLDGQPFQLIKVTRDDVARVDALMGEVLSNTTDEMTPASRKMLAVLQAWAAELPLTNGVVHRWTRREIRERTGWSDTQVRMVLEQLVEFEYLLQFGAGQGKRAFYQIAEAPSTTLQNPTSQNFALTSQSKKSEVFAPASSLVAAAKKEEAATSQTFSGVQASLVEKNGVHRSRTGRS